MLIDKAESDKFDIGCNTDREDKTVKRLLCKRLNRATGYLTPNVRVTFTQLRQIFTKALIF